MKIHTDFLVIGTGVAGLTYAVKVAEAFPEKRIIIATKSDELESNTRYAQGGIAVALNPDVASIRSHFMDTLNAGDHLNNYSIVDLTVGAASLRLKEIVEWGASFDKKENGEYDLCLEGGHSEKRILHHKDLTGLEIQRTLLTKIHSFSNVEIRTHFFAKDLILNESESSCAGALFNNALTGEEYEVLSGIVVLSTGGAGQVYKNTTNPLIATGDGIAMAYRAGAVIENMEFIQFHPTALYFPGENPSFLISEAVRGEGAVLLTKSGRSFMREYSYQESLAPRDIVARAIETEMKKNGDDHIFLDCTNIPTKKFKDHFPNIFLKCQSIGLELNKDFIPVAPAAHYLCGGIKTNKWGQTSILNLYAIGECASTGLHGANRLASNSLLEALVFAHQAFLHSSSQIKKDPSLSVMHEKKESSHCDYASDKRTDTIKEKINLLMTECGGIVRDYESLSNGLRRLNEIVLSEIDQLPDSFSKIEVLNIATVSKLILQASLERKENRGLYFNRDLVNDQAAQLFYSSKVRK